LLRRKNNYFQSDTGYYRRSNRFRKGFRRYSLKNTTKLVTSVLILFLCGIAIYVAAGGDFHPVKAVMSAIAPTPTPTPSPTHTPTLEPTPTPTPEPTPTPPPAGKAISNVIVAIDPGHGGRDPGTVSPYEDGFYEKDINLDIAFRLKEKFEEAGIEVVMTRTADKELHYLVEEDIWARPRIANEAGATFFVSIHVNAFDTKINKWEIYNGTEIYHYGKTHGEFTSKQFAQIMGEEIDAVTDTKYNGVVKWDYGVLRLSNMPALLVEIAYITNKEDHARLKSDKFRDEITQGIFNGSIKILETMGAYVEDGVYKILEDI
jgi:N-acetylmuramoyl-L-alanine amidase